MVLYSGANVRYAKRPILEVVKDFAEIRPTFCAMVPRILIKLYPAMKAIYESEGSSQKIKAVFGGRLSRFGIGSAPIAAEVL